MVTDALDESISQTFRVGAGVLLTDRSERILLVKRAYKEDWEVPGR